MTLAHIVLHGWDWFYFALVILGAGLMGFDLGRKQR